MATALPFGFVITSINGKRCTAVPRAGIAANGSSNATSAQPISIAQTTAIFSPAAIVPLPQTVAGSSAAQKTTIDTSTPPPPPQVPASSTSSIAVVAAAIAVNTLPITTSQSTETPTLATSSNIDTVPTETPASQTSVALATVTPITADPIIADPITATSTSVTPIPDSTPAISPSLSPTTPLSSLRDTRTLIAQSAVTIQPISTDSSSLLGTSYSTTERMSASSATTLFPSAVSLSASGAPSSPRIGAMVGGTIGGLAFLSAIIMFWWWYTRKRRPRDSLLTPLTTPNAVRRQKYYEFDGNSVGPTCRSDKIRAQLGFHFQNFIDAVAEVSAAVKDKLNRRNSAPSVNMDRGNSQFLESIPQHSRSNSAISANIGEVTTLDRLKDWWERLTADANFNFSLRRKSNDLFDPSAADRNKAEQDAQANSDATLSDFYRFLETKDNERRQAVNHRRRSQSMSEVGSMRPQSEFGSLSLDFSNTFVDPQKSGEPGSLPNLFTNGPTNQTLNPFTDPIKAPKAATSKPFATATSSNYVSDVRRSRGLSISTNFQPASRVQSIRMSKESYRDTVLSSFSNNTRKGKGRSDPFDLERPEFWQPPVPKPGSPQPAMALPSRNVDVIPVDQKQILNGGMNRTGEATQYQATILSRPRVVSIGLGKHRVVSDDSFTSRYSNTVSGQFTGDWGDPGPDLGSLAEKDIVTGASGNQSSQGNAGVGRAM